MMDQAVMSPRRSLLYGLANLSYFLAYATFNSYVLFFYTDQLRVSAHLIGLGWLLFGFWNGLNDLILGWLSDHVPRRLGRRTFFIRIFSIPLGVSFLLIWNPPRFVLEMGNRGIFWYFLLIISLYDLLQTAVNISQGAAFPEIATRADVRAQVSATRQGLGLLGTALGVAVSPLIYDKGGWGLMGAVWGVLVSLLYLLSLPGFRGEGIEGEPVAREAASWRVRAKLLLANPPLLIFMAFSLAIRFALACVQIAMPFYVQYVLGLPAGQLSIVLGVMLGSAVVTVPVWPWLLRRLDPRGAGLLIVCYLAVLLLPFLFVNDLASALVLAVLFGPAYGGMSVVLDLIYAQVVDADLVNVGRSRAGIFSGMLGTTLRLSPALAGWMLGALLTAARYDPKLPVQPASVAPALRLLMVAMPGAGLLLGGVFLWLYPIHGRRLCDLQAQISRMHRLG